MKETGNRIERKKEEKREREKKKILDSFNKYYIGLYNNIEHRPIRKL